MATQIVASMVLAITGIDLMKSDDNFPTHDDGMWFCGVTYNDTKYRTVKVVGDVIEFFKNHPLSQNNIPDIRYVLGIVEEERSLPPLK